MKFFCFFFSFLNSVKSPASGKENVRFPDSLDFENSPDFQSGLDVMSGRALIDGAILFGKGREIGGLFSTLAILYSLVSTKSF